MVGSSFKEESTNPRIGFIRKVYGILSCQLLAPVLLCILAISSTTYFNFMFSSFGLALMIICFVLTLIIAIMLSCYMNISRSVPTNYILLCIFTVCEGYLVSYSCVLASPKIVFMAAVMTLGNTVSLTIYAMTTKKDFTYLGGMLAVFGMVFFLVRIFMMFTDNPVLHIYSAGFGVCLFGVYLIYDTQLIMGNKKHELMVNDYVLGALFLYLDIINIFLYVLKILKKKKKVNNN